MSAKRFVVGMTGASGAPYALCLLEELLRQGHEVHLVVTEAAWRVLKEEHDWDVSVRETVFRDRWQNLPGRLIHHPIKDIGASIASGSYPVDGMAVIPCSMGTLAKLAAGLSTNLLERAADVMIKEGRPLVLVPRETPLSPVHLENMLRLSRIGVKIVPAMPAFYHRPETLDDIVRFVAGKALDQMSVPHQLYRRWEGRR